MRTRVSFFVSILFLCFFWISNAHAQSAAGVELKPSTIEDKADPGTVLQKELSVTNKSNSTQTYYLIAKDISGVGDSGMPIFADPGAEVTGFELSTWLLYPIEPITLSPGTSIQVPVTITVPGDATPGSHFGGLFVSVEPPRLRESGAGVGYEVGAIVSIRISGDVIESARIREFSTDKLLYSSPDVKFLARIENPGNVLVRPRGPLSISNMFGKQVALLTVNDTLGGVFPGTTRPYEISWSGEGLGFGRYQAVLGLSYGEDDARGSISGTVSFWVLPTKVILPILGVLSLLILVIYLGVKLYIRRALDELSTTSGRRVVARRRKDSGLSRLMMVAVTLLVATTLFLIGLLVFFA